MTLINSVVIVNNRQERQMDTYISDMHFINNLEGTYIHVFIVNPDGSMIHQYYKKSLKNAIKFTIETPLWRATMNVSTPLPQVVAARCPDSH